MFKGLKIIGIIITVFGAMVMLSVMGTADINDARGIYEPLLPFGKLLIGAGLSFIGINVAVFGYEREVS